MKTLITIMILCVLGITKTAYCQQTKGMATYNIKLAEDNLFFEGNLYFNDNASTFRYKNNKENRLERWESDNQSQVIYTDSIGEIFKHSYRDNFYEVRTFCKKKPILYNDYFELNWILGKEEKNIGGVLCKNASTTFRDRDYNVWYAPSIPVSAGPWKFHGLPGLVFEVSDNEGAVEIYLINFKNYSDASYSFNPTQSSKISFKNYLKCKDEEWEERVNKDMANLAKLRAKFPDLELDVTHDKKGLTERKYD